MDAIQMTAKSRDKFGKEATAKYRQAGQLPAILYGLGENASLLFNKSAFIKSLKGSPRINPVLALTIEGATENKCYAIVKEVQKHPLTRELLHIDLQKVAEDKKITVLVRVQYTGISKGVKNEGGMLTIQRKKLRLHCLPKDIPETIEVDITDIGAGEKIQVSGISAGEGISFVDRPDTTIMTVKKAKGGADKADEAKESAEESK